MKGQISKGLRTTILIYAIWWAIYGLLHVVSPELMQAVDPAIERVLGGTAVALAIGAGLAYFEKTWDSVRIMVLMQAIWMIVYALTMVHGLLTGGIVAAAWPPAIIAAAFAVLLGVLYAREMRVNA